MAITAIIIMDKSNFIYYLFIKTADSSFIKNKSQTFILIYLGIDVE